jgi:hypothetical protein
MPAAITNSHPKNSIETTVGGNSAHNSENPKEQQADAKGQEPAPIVDDLRRNADVQRRDFRHFVLPFVSSGDVGGSFGRTRTVLSSVGAGRKCGASASQSLTRGN